MVGSGHAAIPQFMDVDKQMEFFIVFIEKHLYTAQAKVRILVPRAFHYPVFWVLAVFKKGEGRPGQFYHMNDVRYRQKRGGGGTFGSKEHILIGLHCTVSAVGNDLYRQFTRPFPLLQKWVWLARPIQNLPDLSLIIRIPYLKCCPFGLLSFTWTDNHSEVARYTGL